MSINPVSCGIFACTGACRNRAMFHDDAYDDRVEDPKTKTRDASVSRSRVRRLVPKAGLEPARRSALPPQGSASTNSATWAERNTAHIHACETDSSMRNIGCIPVRFFTKE